MSIANMIYEQERNRLIPEAERFANNRAGHRPTSEAALLRWYAKWNFAFHTRMNELAKKEGLV